MDEQTAVRYLLAHFMHRMNEFLNENKPEEIDEKELGTRFARWLYAKDAKHEHFKTAEGVIAQHMNIEQVQDENSLVLAQLKLFKDRGIGLLWMSDLFVNPALAMPDFLREDIVQTLRFHADRVETREIDERVKQVQQSVTGAA